MSNLVPVRTWLLQNGISNIGWDNSTKTILINGKPFMSLNSGLFKIKNSRAYADINDLTNALKNFFVQNQLKEPTTFGKVINVQTPGQGGASLAFADLNKYKPNATTNTTTDNPYLSPTNEPGAGPGTEDVTSAQSSQPIAEAQQSGELPVYQNENTETPQAVGATDVGQTQSPFDLQESINEKTLQSQLNSYDSILNSLKQPSPLMDKINEIWNMKLKAALDSLQQKYNTQLAALKGEKAKVLAAHKGEIEEIDKAIQAARKRSAEDMNARGLYFSGLLTKALNSIEEKGLSLKAQALAKKTAELDSIAAQVAALTSNYALAKDQATNLALTNKALEEMKLLEKNQDKIDQINMLQAGIQAQLNALKATAPERKKLYNIEQQQLQQQELQKQKQQEFENWLKVKGLELKYQNADLDNRKQLFNEWLQTQNLSLDKQKELANEWYKEQLVNLQKGQLDLSAQKEKDLMQRFYDDLAYKYKNMDLNNAYRQASLALKQAAQKGLVSPDLASGWQDLYKMGPVKIQDYIMKLEKEKNAINNQATMYNNGELTPEQQKLLDSINDAESIAYAISNLANSTRDITPDNVYKARNAIMLIAPKIKFADAPTFIQKYIADPVARVAAWVMISAHGDQNQVNEIMKAHRQNILGLLQQYGADPNDPNTVAMLDKLLNYRDSYGNYGGF